MMPAEKHAVLGHGLECIQFVIDEIGAETVRRIQMCLKIPDALEDRAN